MKKDRHKKILEIISDNVIETQEELSDMLFKAGYEVTQATVSRDIRELGIMKVSVDNRTQRYVSVIGSEYGINNRLLSVLKTGYISSQAAGNLIVIKTAVGMAMAVAAAVDSLKMSEVIGCIAGDDTIFCAIKNLEDVNTVMNKFDEIVNS
jgi:transcriptional regulator of arginine metabolism